MGVASRLTRQIGSLVLPFEHSDLAPLRPIGACLPGSTGNFRFLLAYELESKKWPNSWPIVNRRRPLRAALLTRIIPELRPSSVSSPPSNPSVSRSAMSSISNCLANSSIGTGIDKVGSAFKIFVTRPCGDPVPSRSSRVTCIVQPLFFAILQMIHHHLNCFAIFGGQLF